MPVWLPPAPLARFSGIDVFLRVHQGLRLLFLLLLFGVPASAAAAPPAAGPWRITAERMESSADGQVVYATGAVEMTPADSGGDTSISADAVVYDRRTATVNARGRVEVNDRNDHLAAETARINLNTGAIALDHGRLYYQPNHLYLKADEISRSSPRTWRFRRLTLSTCEFGGKKTADWAFGAGRGRLTVDGYAFLTNVTFRVRDFPVFYLPWLLFPAKITRQSGFLFPQISSSSRDGFGLVTPFFVNISPSLDLTLSPGFYGRRGASFGLEGRYRAGRDSAGMAAVSFLNDRSEDCGQGPDDDYRGDGWLRDRHDRYWARGKIDQWLGEHTRLALDFDLSSDPDFILEYRDAVDGFRQGQSRSLAMFHRGYQDPGLSQRENILALGRTVVNGFAGIEAVGVDDLREAAAPGTAVQTLPRIVSNLRLPLPRVPATLALESDYVNYYRRQGRGYQRFSLSPTLVAALPARFLEGKASLGSVNRVYRVEAHGDGSVDASTEEANAAVFRANIASTWERDFLAGRIQHSLRPNLVYTFVDPGHGADVPVIDADDHLAPANNITWELNNYFRSRMMSAGGTVTERLAARFKLSQAYDLIEARSDPAPGSRRRPFGDLNFDLEFYPSDSFYFRYQSALNFYGDHITHSSVEGRYSRGSNTASLNYTEARGSARDLTAAVRIAPMARISLAYEVTRSLLYDHLVRENVAVTYSPGCWGLTLEAVKDSEDRRVMLLLTLSGLGNGLRFER